VRAAWASVAFGGIHCSMGRSRQAAERTWYGAAASMIK
jgi:hypothetical protein